MTTTVTIPRRTCFTMGRERMRAVAEGGRHQG
jgi:hypothetical protein